MTLIKDIKYNFYNTTILNKFIYLNVALFLIFNILSVVFGLFMIDTSKYVVKFILPSNTQELITQPWTLITYMFMHENFIHLFFNLLWLHFGGKLFLEYFNEKQFISTYILGGIAGGLLFILAFNYLPALKEYNLNAKALGASASVLAIMFAISTHIPNFKITLPFLGSVKIKYLAFAFLILDILSIPKGNAGGHIAHIGGAIFGFLYIKQLNKGFDISKNFYQLFSNSFFNKKTKKRKKNQKNIDIVLEKISKSGYNSLSKSDKELLFKASEQKN